MKKLLSIVLTVFLVFFPSPSLTHSHRLSLCIEWLTFCVSNVDILLLSLLVLLLLLSTHNIVLNAFITYWKIGRRCDTVNTCVNMNQKKYGKKNLRFHSWNVSCVWYFCDKSEKNMKRKIELCVYMCPNNRQYLIVKSDDGWCLIWWHCAHPLSSFFTIFSICRPILIYNWLDFSFHADYYQSARMKWIQY